MSSGLLQVFVELGNLHETSNYVLYWRLTIQEYLYPAMANGIRTGDPRGFNKRRSLKFRVGSRVQQTPEEGRRTYRPKRCGNNNKDEDNSPRTLNDKNHQASSQKFRKLKRSVQLVSERYIWWKIKFFKSLENTATAKKNSEELLDKMVKFEQTEPVK